MNQEVIAGFLEAIPQPSVLVDQTERFIGVNAAGQRLLGERILGRHFATVLRQPNVTGAIEKTLEDRGSRSTKHLSNDGAQDTSFEVSLRYVPGIGAVEGGAVLLCFSDVTEREQAGQMRRDFVANVSHELRTPLNAIIGFSELMLIRGHGQIDLADYDQYVGSIHSSGAHLLSVINDILDLSKIEAGMLVLAENDVDPKAVITGSMNFVTEKAAEAGVNLSDRTADALPGVFGDSRKLTQVLTNLLANAVKFTPEGGRVEIEAGTREDGSFWISVSDTGIGIPQEDIGRVFEPFVQVDGSLNRKFDGTGLGLPLSKALIELHGGTLCVTSVVDRGTTATIELPGSRIRARVDVAAG